MISFAILADPATFYDVLFTFAPFIKYILPKMMYEYICKSVEHLQEGERRVAEMEENKNKSNGSKSKNGAKYAVSNQALFNEIRKRIQWRYVIPCIASGACVKAIAYEKPKVIGEMMDAVVKENATIDTAFWPFLRQLVLFVIFDYIFISMREYYKHAAVHRYQADARADMIANILDQDQNYITSDNHSDGGGFAHLMNRETARMQIIINESFARLVFGLICK